MFASQNSQCIVQARLYLTLHKERERIFLPTSRSGLLSRTSAQNITGIVPRSDSTFSSSAVCSNYLPTPGRLFFPPPALRFPPAQIRRCPDEIHQPYRVGAPRGRPGLCPLPRARARAGRLAFLGSYRKHAHVPCIKPGGGRRGSKVVWFHVRRVQRLPSLHATHEIPKVQVSRVSRGDALLTVCRAAMLVISSLFFPPCPFSGSVANYTWGMRNVCCGRAREATEQSFAAFFSDERRGYKTRRSKSDSFCDVIYILCTRERVAESSG